MKRNSTDGKKRNVNILKEMDPDTALEVLRRLSKKDPKIKVMIENIALELLKGINTEDIATDVFHSLDSLHVEDLWDSSGSTRYGYVDPSERAWEMFEESLEPFVEEMERYRKLSMKDEARNYFMGILMGVHRFEKEATTDFADWAVDAPHEYFIQTLDEWNRKCKDKEEGKSVDSFCKKNFEKWYKEYNSSRRPRKTPN